MEQINLLYEKLEQIQRDCRGDGMCCECPRMGECDDERESRMILNQIREEEEDELFDCS